MATIKDPNVWASITTRFINVREFSQDLDLNICVKTKIKSLSAPSTSFPVHYSLIILTLIGIPAGAKVACQ
jgi:hypothetical protein